MSSDTRQATDTAAEGRNGPARVALWAAFLGIGLILGMVATPVFWLMWGGWYTLFVFLCACVAIPAGHLGRRRGKRLGGRDRGAALFAIVAGWLLMVCCLLLVVAYAGLVAGLAVLVDSAR
ncbi:DUF4190 domain-containing protein [Streptomyces syringium]|uniref:DUF4190 domain-containing protein n=1 Tax=Streptomyces syringium TaxID=76729 RepID=UPI0034034E90